jgi:FMN phosphatase YigB (HAD superfamily)
MSLTLLLDLDDTLLSNDIETFLPAYIQSLAASANQVPARLFMSSLLAASEMMVRKSQISGTLESTFDAHFYPAIGFSKEQMRKTIDDFYQEKYPFLQPLTQSRPIAQDLVNDLISSGNKVVIATNPLFPATAIRQRLNWAGFEDLQKQFSIITSFETFHFSKPHPEYFAEILAQLAWPDQPAVMVGNSWKDDIIPAESIGLATFFLSEAEPANTIVRHPLSSHGKLSDIAPWIKKISTNPSHTFSLSPQGFLTALRTTPAAAEIILKRISQIAAPKALSLINNAIHQDISRLGGNMPGSITSTDLPRVSQAFIESRIQLLDQIANFPEKYNLQNLFLEDKSLLRALLSIKI